MKSNSITLIFSALLILTMLACDLSAAAPTSLSQSAIASVVAQTMQAVASASPTLTPIVLNTPVLSMPSPTATPMAAINANAECRSGPSEKYKSIVSMNVNQTVAVLGQDPTGMYWLVQTDSGQCWLAMKSVTVTGSTQFVPTVTPPPLTTGLPSKPGSLFYQWSGPCSNLTTSLTWADTSDNETGFHVYRDGNLIVTLPPNSTSYTDTTTISIGATITYSVTAYNNVGESAARVQSFQCK
jgi:hypothetical protein